MYVLAVLLVICGATFFVICPPREQPA